MKRNGFSVGNLLKGAIAIAVVVAIAFLVYRFWPRNYETFDLSAIATIDTSDHHTLIVLDNGELWGVGDGQDRQLGISASSLLLAKKNSYTGDKYTDRPIRIMDEVIQAQAGYNFSLALKSDNTLWGFGYNVNQELGVDTDSDWRNQGIKPTRIMDGIVQMDSGGRHSMALRADGSLWGIGANEYGQLGVNNLSYIGFLDPPHVMDEVKAVFCGLRSSFALRIDGSLWSMGRNAAGELGYLPEQEENHVPRKIADNIAMVAAYGDHTLILTNDGEVKGMGDNSVGQLGLEEAQAHTPTSITDDAMSIAIGRSHSLILKHDGSLWGMGDNTHGQLGLADVAQVNQLTKVLDGVKAVYAAANHTLLLTDTGELVVWGANDHGQIGLPGIQE